MGLKVEFSSLVNLFYFSNYNFIIISVADTDSFVFDIYSRVRIRISILNRIRGSESKKNVGLGKNCLGEKDLIQLFNCVKK